MAEPAAASGLAASAPTRDLLRPAQRSGQRLGCALPAVPRPLDEAGALAAVALLLATHARLTQVEFVLRRQGRRCSVRLQPARGRPLAELLAQAQRALQEDTPLPTAEPVSPAPDGAIQGVLVDFDPDPPPPADLRLDLAAGRIDADADLYLPQSLPPLARQLAHLLAQIERDQARSQGELSLDDDAERERVRRGFNALRLPLPPQATLASMIDAQLARRDAAAVCAVHGQARLSWAELGARSQRLAQQLVACGVAAGRFVALLEHRGLDFVVALVAIWKAGGAYIPIDPGYPAERVRTMLGDSEATVAIVGARAWARFEPVLRACPALRHVLCPHEALPAPAAGTSFILHDRAASAAAGTAPLPPRCGPRDPAYMLYTSGSTGRPKGAIVRHDGAVNHILAQVHALGRDSVAHFLQSAPASSDISVWQFAAPLALGGLTVIVDDATDVAGLLAEIRRHRLQLIELVPTVMRYLIDYAAALPAAERELPSLRFAMVTGEAASVELVNDWLALYPRIPIVNAYGPTEAADDVCQALLAQPLPPRLASVPIGRPLANLDLHVLDEALRPLPVGALGEICVAGVGVGDGYWRQAEKTQAAFVANPFAPLPGAAGAVLYRTGDLGRWRDDGSLECAGRLDHQVQLRGQRIELPEIEAVLRQHPGVADAVAKVFHDSGSAASPGGRRTREHGRLVAFVVPAAGAAADVAAWREHLAARLPAAMLPATFVPMAALPLNPAGKVDRGALLAPAAGQAGAGAASAAGAAGAADAAASADADGRAPRNALEALLAQLWAQELGRARVGTDDDFFALGGDSMSALAISVGARAAGWQLRSADVLAHPTVARLAARAKAVPAPAPAAAAAASAGAGPEADPDSGVDADPDAGLDAGSDANPDAVPVRALQPLSPAVRARFLAAHAHWVDVQPLTPAQQALFVHWLLARDKRAYVDQLGYALDGALDADAFAAAWQHVVERQPALRAGFLRSALPQPVQVTARRLELALRHVDLGALAPEAQDEAWRALCREEVERGFDLAQPPLMRLLLARLGPQRHALAWTHHHLLLDGWSLATVLRQVLAAHAAAPGGARAVDPGAPPRVDDQAYRAHLAAASLREARQHWRRTLQGAPPAPPWAFGAPAAATPGFGELDFGVDEPIRAALLAAAAGHGVTLGTLLQAAWALVLARHGGGSDLVFGVVGSGRELPVQGIEHMVGLFVVTQPLRVRVDDEAPLGAWLAALQAQAAAARAHEALPLAAAVREAGLPPGRPLFETLFVLWNFPTLAQPLPGPLQIRPTHYRTVPAYALSLIAVPAPTLQLRLVHDRQRLEAHAVAALRDTLLQTLQQLARGDDPRRSI